MSRWIVGEPALSSTRELTVKRLAAERVVGEQRAAELARHVSIARGTFQSLGTADGRRTRHLGNGLKDRHLGETCVLIGNGPSLRDTPLDLVRHVPTFGLNRLYLLFDELGWGTTYHVVVNRHVVEQCAGDLLKVPGQLISTWPNRAELSRRPDAIFLPKLVGPLFSKRPSRGIWEGATVTYVGMQMAYWMGFKKVVLVGVDHRFATQGDAHALVTSEGDDPNHFHPSYFGKGFKWQLPDLQTSEIAYQLARRVFEADGRQIVDATVDGALQVFPKMSLDAALSP